MVDTNQTHPKSYKSGRFILQFNLWELQKKFIWGLLLAYGAPREENMQDFLVELDDFCSNMYIPYIVGGDFNILRHGGGGKNQIKS